MTLPAIAYIDMAANAIPVGAALFRMRTKRGAALFVGLLFTSNLLVEIVTLYLAKRRIHNLAIVNGYDLAEFLLVLVYFYSVEGSLTWKRTHVAIGVAYLVFWTFAKLTFEPIYEPAPYTHTIAAALLAMIAVRALTILMQEEMVVLYREDKFWISLATCFYFFTNLVLYGYLGPFSHLPVAQAIHFWTIHWSLSVTAKLLFTFAFVWTPKT